MTLTEHLVSLAAKLETDGKYSDAHTVSLAIARIKALHEAAWEGINQLDFCHHFLPVRDARMGEVMAPREQIGVARELIMAPLRAE